MLNVGVFHELFVLISLIHRIFLIAGVCRKCGKQRTKLEALLEMHVSLDECLEKAVERLLSVEEMEYGNFPRCDNCKSETPHTMQSHIIQLPQLLVIVLQRYELKEPGLLDLDNWFKAVLFSCVNVVLCVSQKFYEGKMFF